MFQSIKKCQGAGITVRMVTGDNIDTARSIAEKCGIIPKGDKSSSVVMEGPKFRQKILDANGEVRLLILTTCTVHGVLLLHVHVQLIITCTHVHIEWKRF